MLNSETQELVIHRCDHADRPGECANMKALGGGKNPFRTIQRARYGIDLQKEHLGGPVLSENIGRAERGAPSRV